MKYNGHGFPWNVFVFFEKNKKLFDEEVLVVCDLQTVISLSLARSLSLSLSLSDASARALSLTLKKNSVGRVLLAARRLCPRGVRVGVWRTGRLSVFQRCRVGYAWTLGLVRRLVALSGLLLRWLSRAFGSYCLGGGWVPKCS